MKHGYLFLTGLCALLATTARAQTGGVRIGTAGTPDAKAVLDLSATDKGLLIPRLDSVQRVGITSPTDGLMVFQTDGRTGFWYAMSGSWNFIPNKTRSGDNLGNHVATQNIVLNGKRLVGGTAATPGTVGLSVDANGLARLGNGYIRPVNNYSNGIGLHISNADAGLLMRTSIGMGPQDPPFSGQGDRLMWTSFYGAFRAGGVGGDQWDGANAGFYSAALGYDNVAAGFYSFAAGYDNEVRGHYSTALGRSNAVSSLSDAGLVFGRSCRVSDSYSVAGGYFNKAQGESAVALGQRCTANADYAIVMGRYASAGTRSGTFTIADGSINDSLKASVNNQFSARYAGGYRLFPNSNMSLGVSLAANGNSWQITSDSTKKELVRLADGNRFLEQINRMRLGSWNYKEQDPRTMRHYGPMAQDFYAAFGHDALGTIGNDSTINQADFDGVNLIAIQALYRQVLELKADNARLRQQGAADGPAAEPAGPGYYGSPGGAPAPPRSPAWRPGPALEPALQPPHPDAGHTRPKTTTPPTRRLGASIEAAYLAAKATPPPYGPKVRLRPLPACPSPTK
ncbi:tail fiber domain-containing protein [Hymenobacter sp. J193]|uniref:tail fiber domain-containing protein n=1 Tax=Hymenobacter sp. J193 TaxID=2898429 RepID=UPI00215130CF|nr:tail fiber domain-containing protein [Hymenobacter sp. J193]MCR5888296.1 tail fiber domain-containing protein [Hymenobacter sp. J193]